MTRQIDVEEAKKQFARLVAAAAKGEEIVLSKGGKPMAKLTAIAAPPEEKKRGKRKFGQWAKLLTPEERAYRRSEQFERDWQTSDAEIEKSFNVLKEDTREFDSKWRDTSSTPMPSSTSKTDRKRSARKRAKR